MPAIPIKDRRIARVTVGALDIDYLEDGDCIAGTVMHIGLSGSAGEDDGPGANFFFAASVEPTQTMDQVTKAIFARGHEMIQRMAKLTPDELEAAFKTHRAKQAEEKKKAEAMGFKSTRQT